MDTVSTDMPWIIAIDPGLDSGIAMYSPGTREIKAWNAPPWTTAEVISMNAKPRSLIVIEGWTPTQGVKSFQPDALELIGYTRHTCNLNGVPFRIQSRSVAKRLFPDARLKDFGLHHSKPNAKISEHKNDAIRHLLLALHSHYFDTFRELEARCTQS